MRKIVLDSNAFILYLAGLVNKNQIGNYARKSDWNSEDFHYLCEIINEEECDIITTPNVLTETDNILNRISGDDKYKYLYLVKNIYLKSIEEYIKSEEASNEGFFDQLGLADSVVLKVAQRSDLLISADSELCRYAEALNIKLVDLTKNKARQYE
ncbi:MAG: hypothetical protein FWE23_06095 [Chitinivibrionia bacterium]|nr:hypothetical protein [Chitinivibrionia bacterium]